MNTRVVSPTVDGPILSASPPAPNKTYALVTIDACVPILGQALTNVHKLFDCFAQPISDGAFLDLCSKFGPAAVLLVPNPHIAWFDQDYHTTLARNEFVWENVLTATLHHLRPKLADGLPHAMNELTTRNITPILLTHRSTSLFNIVFDSLSSEDQNTIRGLFPRSHRLAASSITKNAHLHSDTYIYAHLGQTPYAAEGHKPFAIEVTPDGTLCATSHGIETIAYDLTKGQTQASPSSTALTASGACAIIRHWRELDPTLGNTIFYPTPKPTPPSIH